MFSLDDYDYDLPEGLIAQFPAEHRDGSRLFCLDRHSGAFSHGRFRDIANHLNPGDQLVINNTEVIPARLIGKKETGGSIEVLILDYVAGLEREAGGGQFATQCLIRASKRPRIGSRLDFGSDFKAEVLDFENGIYTLEFTCHGPFEKALYRIGAPPLPPYIRRETGRESPCDDPSAYQTIYASRKGAVAAPTAGLHFTRSVLDEIRGKGVTIHEITLHVGYGTFLPVRVKDIRAHQMHSERYDIGRQAADAINRAKAKGGRIIAVGTTSVRTLEHAVNTDGKIVPGSGASDLFIYPGFRFQIVDGMITNFHLPRSTLLMLVSAFADRDTVLAAYREAVAERYRFFSYGDAMLIL